MFDPSSTADSTLMLPLLYHELRPAESEYTYALPVHRFTEQLAAFAQNAVDRPLDYRPVLTFDDGHVSNYEYALPVLEKHGVRAHFFITAGWTETRADSLTWAQLRTLQQAGHVIGAHGWSHTLLTHCSAAELDHELRDARERLEDGLGAPVTSMSLPGGRANAKVMDACRRAGYTTVWTSSPRAEASPLGPVVGRLNILAGMSDAWLLKLLDPSSGVLESVQRKHRWKAAGQRVLGDRVYAGLWALLNRKEPEALPVSKVEIRNATGESKL